jgi:precorrin-8X/cobalt-precorrin-8 methylmutase
VRQYSYNRDPQAIYRESFEIVAREVDFSIFPAEQHPVVTRLVHACGMPEIVPRLRMTTDLVPAATQALLAGAPILCDCEMVAAAITRKFVPANNEIIVTLNHPNVASLATELKTTRSAAAVDLWQDKIAGAVVAIGNAPTALFHLLDKLRSGAMAKPAAILAMPVGFVGAAESKHALIEADINVAYLTLTGRQGGSPLAAAAANALNLISTGQTQ